MTTYHQETVLAMELNGSHVGRLVQIITDSWSMTGTLTRVDQHDNREWEIVYPARTLVPSGGEIYTTLTIGPWTGRVIGNQPVTVESVAGTLEAPERALEGTVMTGPFPPTAGELKAAIIPGLTGTGYTFTDPPAPDVIPGEGVDVEELRAKVAKGEITINAARAKFGLPELPGPPWSRVIHATDEEVEEWAPVRAALDEAVRNLPPLPPAPVEWPDLPASPEPPC